MTIFYCVKLKAAESGFFFIIRNERPVDIINMFELVWSRNLAQQNCVFLNR